MTRSTRVQLSRLSLALVAALAMAPAFAQSTSSGVTGVVTGADGKPVAGADVTITHVESGTVRHATTDDNGRYSAQGLRVGGPYTIVVHSSAGDDTESDIYLALNQVSTVNARLGSAAESLETITVTAARISPVFSPDNTGVGTSVNGRQLQTAVSGSRTLDEIARLDPRITVVDSTDGSISLAGVNNRFNSIQVDGLNQGDPFGLNSNGMPYTGSPISPDTIAAYDIKASDYDVTSDSVGASINAVTKSGTNEFHGSLYYAYKNADNMVGDILSNPSDPDSDRVGYTAFDKDTTYGVTIGGPIVKDKLFFFLSGEKQKVTNIGAFPNNGYASGKVTDADLATVEAAAAAYGLQAGIPLFKNPGSTGLALENDRYLAKLDWNITDGQRLSFTYQDTKENKPTPYDASGSNAAYSSHYYNINSRTKNFALQLFSDWSDNFSTEFKVSQQKFDQVAGNALNQPMVQIYTPGGGSIFLGEDQYRHENEIHTKTLSASLAGTWYVGNHTIKGGVDYEKNDINDLFGRALHGVLTFNSPDDFANGILYRYSRTVIPDGFGLSDMGFPMSYTQISPFLQDSWQVTSNLLLTYGVRVNIPDTNRAPPALTGATLEAYERVVGFANNSTLDSKVVEPRFGFNYAFNTERMSQLRGGVGLFQTSPPTVWIFNPYQNNGVNGLLSTSNTNGETVEQLLQDVNNYNVSDWGGASGSRPQVDAISPDFKLPTAWKFSLGYDAELPWWGVVASVDFLRIKNKDAIIYTEPNTGIASTGASPTVLPDGRIGYWTNGLPTSSAYLNSAGQATCYVSQTCNGVYVANDPSFTYNSTVLGNTDEGYSNSLTFALSRPLINGWAWNLSATFASAKEVNPGNSSQATSNYQIAMVNPNTSYATTSDRSIAKTIKASLTWDHAFFGDYRTTVSAYYTGHTGQPYSWVFGTGSGIIGDVNGDNQYGYDLAYIPTVNDANVVYVSGANPATQAQIDAFNAFINNDDYLRMHRGQIATHNGAHGPWSNQLDIGFQQEIPGLFKGNKAIIRLDISNFLNLLNKDWGQIETVNTFNPRRNLAYVSGFTADGKYIYDLSKKPTDLQTWYTSGGNLAPSRVSSTWSALLTLKYTF
jgi:hypothetical protein